MAQRKFPQPKRQAALIKGEPIKAHLVVSRILDANQHYRKISVSNRYKRDKQSHYEPKHQQPCCLYLVVS